MADTETEPLYVDRELQDIPLTPTFAETAKSSFWRLPTTTLLYQPLLAERMFPSDETPVDDVDIEKRLRDENMTDWAESFVKITTKGELEAQVGKVKHERKQDAIAAASGWTGFALDFALGMADPLSIATFKAAAATSAVRAGMASKSLTTRLGTVAAEGAAGGAVAAGALAAGNETTTLADAPGIIAGSAFLPVALYGGGSLAKRFLGKAAELIPPNKLEEFGDGLKADLQKFEPTVVETPFTRLPTDENSNVTAALRAKDGTIFHIEAPEGGSGQYTLVSKTTQDGQEVTSIVGKFDDQDAAFNAIGKDARKSWEAPTENTIVPPEVETAPVRAVEEYTASVEKNRKGVDLNSPDAKTVMAFTGRNTVDPYELSAYQLAKSWGGDKVAKHMLRLGITRGSPAMELATSSIPAARRANALLNFTKGALEDVTNPESFYTKYEQVRGQKDQFVETVTSRFKAWRKKNLGVPQIPLPVVGQVLTDMAASTARVVRSKLTGDDFSESEFHDLVYRAMVYGDDIRTLPDGALRQQLLDPDVQAAAKSFRDFDTYMGDMAVKSGLMRRSRLQEAHIGRNYNRFTVSEDFENFINLEADAAYNHQWNDTVRRARQKETSDLVKAEETHKQTVEKRLQEFDEETPQKIEEAVKKARDDARAQRDTALEEAKVKSEQKADETREAMEKENDEWFLKKVRALNNKAKREKWEPEQLEAAEADLRADASARLDDRLTAALDRITNAYERTRNRTITRYKRGLNEALTAVKSAIRKDRRDERLDLIDELEAAHTKERIKIRETRAKATSEANRIDTMRWARQHAEGVFQAIATGQTGNRAVERGAGNQRGSRIARNVFMSDRTLLDNGWLDTDLYKVVDKAVRIDGSDAVLATLFRRPLTPDEVSMVDNDSPDAYWADGTDKYTAPDLEMTVPIDEIRTQGEEMRRLFDEESGAPTHPNIDTEIRNAIENLQTSVELARGTFTGGTDSIGQTGRASLALWKSLQFTYWMGRSMITNVGDVGRFVAAHGMKDTLQYTFTRMAERARDVFEGRGGFTKEQIAETMKDANIGLDQFGFARTSGVFDVLDPWTANARGNRVDQFAAKLTHIGARTFGLHMWNNLVTRAAGGIAMNRMVRLAYTDGELSARDAEWLKFIGLTRQDLATFRQELGAQGIGEFKPYRTHIVDNDKLSDAMRSKFLSALVRDVRTTVVTPNPANLPMFMQNPLLSVFMQFKSFSMESAQSVHLRRAQIAASGDYSLAMQGLLSMTAAAYGAYLLKGVAESYLDGDVGGDKAKAKSLEKRLNAHRDNLGGLIYEVMDYGGVSPLLFTYNNMVEDVFGVGIKKSLQSHFGDKNPGGLLSSARSQGRAQPGTLIGPGYRTLARMANVGQDVLGVGNRRVTKDTIKNVMGLVPYTGTFYLRGVTSQTVDAIAYGFGLPNKQPPR